MSSYRNPQQLDLINDLALFDNRIPIMVNTGNHDINESPDKITVGAHQYVWGDPYFTFWVKGHIFLALESQFFRSEDQKLGFISYYTVYFERIKSYKRLLN